MTNDINTKNNYIKPATEIAVGGLLIKRGMTSGLRRALGVRIEEHITPLANARNIIKNGCILDPSYGGSGASLLRNEFKENSNKFVHITGFHKDFMKPIMENPTAKGLMEPIIQSKWYKRIFETPLFNFVREGYRKLQGLLYSTTSTIQMPSDGGGDMSETMSRIIKESFNTKKQVFKNIFNIITKRKCKTFYIGGTDKFFNENFMPDIDDFALKTEKPLKVFKTKIGATIDAIKREGLSGIKQNKTRVMAGLILGGACLYMGCKLIKKGINNLKSNNQKETPDSLQAG